MSESSLVTEDVQCVDNISRVFDLGLKDLIKEKSDVLVRLSDAKVELINAEAAFKQQEANLILTTNFKELGLTNEKMRNAYIHDELYELKDDVIVKKCNISLIEYELEIINDLIRLNELEYV